MRQFGIRIEIKNASFVLSIEQYITKIGKSESGVISVAIQVEKLHAAKLKYNVLLVQT